MDIGFYLLDIAADNEQQKIILNSINELCKKLPYSNIVLFNNQFNNIDLNHKYYILHIQQAKYFDGILFIFDTKSAMLTKTFPGAKKQVLYISEPEWSKNPGLPYGFWHSIYMQNNLEVITNNKDTYELCNICWKQPLSLMSEFNSEEIYNVITKL